REGMGLVRVDGAVFSHSIYVGDSGAKSVRPGDKVVMEMIRFPSPEERGEGVITEVLGPHNKPGVDLLSIIREFDLSDEFPEEVLEEAREMAAVFDEKDLDGREDLTGLLTVTIDPVDARDFDDAVSLTIDPKSRHWQLGVHIADVSHFAPPGSALDREARTRGTSVYLPQRVLPMFPEVISNSLASLQQGRVRYTKSVLTDFTPAGLPPGRAARRRPLRRVGHQGAAPVHLRAGVRRLRARRVRRRPRAAGRGDAGGVRVAPADARPGDDPPKAAHQARRAGAEHAGG